MKLYGSLPSPFVRRIRMLLENIDYEFHSIDIFQKDIREFLKIHNPTMKVPMLIDEEQVILDSNVIYSYLKEKLSLESLTWPQLNLLTTVNAANDSLVSLLMLSRSNINVGQDSLFFSLQQERLEESFKCLEDACSSGQFSAWNYLSIALFCLLDWADFRDLYQFESYPNLYRFWQETSKLEVAELTDPRKA